MYPKKTAPPTIERVTAQKELERREKMAKPPTKDVSLVKIDELYYPERVKGVVQKYGEKWEDQAIRAIKAAFEHVTNWELMIDGGAFIGRWAAFMPFRKVLAFEPIYANRMALVMNCKGHHNVEISDKALTSWVGNIELGIKEGVFGNVNAKGQRATYPCTRIDALNVTPGLIKLDLDGCDLEALKGAQGTLERCSPVLCVEHKLDREGIVEHLKRIGYKQKWKDKRDSVWVR